MPFLLKYVKRLLARGESFLYILLTGQVLNPPLLEIFIFDYKNALQMLFHTLIPSYPLTLLLSYSLTLLLSYSLTLLLS